jgi:hypothetical protein
MERSGTTLPRSAESTSSPTSRSVRAGAALHQRHRCGADVDPDPFTLETLDNRDAGAAAAEGIEHEVTGVAVSLGSIPGLLPIVTALIGGGLGALGGARRRSRSPTTTG